MQNLAKTSAACIAGAVLLNILPWFGGPGWIWSLLLLGGVWWIWDGRATQSQLVTWALVACAHALDNFYIGIGTLPWLAGAFFAVRAVLPLFDVSRIRRGYAPYAAIGALLCLWAMFWTWGKTPRLSGASFMGGLDLNTHYDGNGNSSLGLDYNATKWLVPYYYPGFPFPGRSLTGAFAASFVLLLILGWTLWGDEVMRHRVRMLPLVGVVFLLVWSVPSLLSGNLGPIVFFAGALAIGFCTVMTLLGHQRGRYDADDVAARVKTEIGKRRAPR